MRDRQVSARLQEIRRLSMERKGLIPKRTVIPRAFIRHIVGRVISRGVSRVLCNTDIAFTRQENPYAGGIQQSIFKRLQTPATGSGATAAVTGNSVMRIGLLLCDLHFGEKYSGLYQKYFDRAAAAKGRIIQWEVFNCIKSQFPSRAYQRLAGAFLVAGGPTSGSTKASSDNPSGTKNFATHRRKVPGWRRSLVRLLRYLHASKQPLAALGLGHVILAEAFGGTCSITGWEDGWNIIPSAFCVAGDNHHRGYPEPLKLGIKYLHGEYVKKMPRARKDLESWRSSDDHHVAGFRDRNTLSFDGFPECGAFIFEAMSEFYDRQDVEVGEGDPSDFSCNWSKGESVPISLEQKKRMMKLKDGSNTVADLILDHFVALSITPKAPNSSKIVDVLASISSDHILDSIKSCWSHRDVGGVVLPLISTADCHALVLSRKILESSTLSAVPRLSSSRRSSLTSEAKPFHLPTLHELHLQLSILGQETPVGSQRRLHRGSFKEMRAGSQRRLSGGSRRSITSLQIGEVESHDGEDLHHVNLSALGLVRFEQAIASCINVSGALRKGSGNFHEDMVEGHPHPPTVVKQPRAVIEFLDYKTGGTIPQFTFIRRTEIELRALWIQFIASLRLHNFGDTKIAVISCQASLLTYFRQRQPLWKLIKDCRVGVSAKPTPARYLVSKLGQYATIADAILLHHEVLLGFSAREIEVVFQQARALGLRVYVSWSSIPSQSPDSPRRMSISSPKALSTSQRRRSSARIIPPLASCSEEDTTKAKLIECVLLLLLGVNGIISSEVDIVMDARQAITDKSELVREAQQLLSKWQDSDGGYGSKKRPSYSRPTTNGTTGSLEISLEDLDEDYMGDVSQHDDDYSVVQKDVAAEMLKYRPFETAPDPSKALMRHVLSTASDERHNEESPAPPTKADGSLRGPLGLLVSNSKRNVLGTDTEVASNQTGSLLMSGLGTRRRLTQPTSFSIRPHPPPPDASRRNSDKAADEHWESVRPAELVLGSGVRMGRRLSVARKSSGAFHATVQPAVGPW